MLLFAQTHDISSRKLHEAICGGHTMTLLLLIVIYMAYIGLGIPDSLLGNAGAVCGLFLVGLGLFIPTCPIWPLFTSVRKWPSLPSACRWRQHICRSC